MAKKAADDETKAQRSWSGRQADWTAKATRARLSGKKGDRDAAAHAAQDLAAAQASLNQASSETAAASNALQQQGDQIASTRSPTSSTRSASPPR